MATTSKELREKRAALVAQGRQLLDRADAEKRPMTAEERQSWDKIFGGVHPDTGERIVGEEEKLLEQIKRLERLETAEGEMRERVNGNARIPGREDGAAGAGVVETAVANGPTNEQRALAFQGWVRAQCGLELREDHKAAFLATGMKATLKDLPINLRRDDYKQVKQHCRALMHGLPYEQRAQSVNVATLGGWTVPEGFVNNLEIALLQYGGMRELADVMRTTSGQDLPWPTVNDTSNKGAILAENGTVTTQDITFGVEVFHAYKYTSKLILVPVELIEDSAFEMANFIGEMAGIRIGRIQADHFTTGTGAAQPNGAITAATSFSAASSTAIAADDLYGLEHSVDPAYRKTGCAWSMNDQILLVIKKLKDGFGRYLWQASLAGGNPDTLAGYPVAINQSMDSTVASGKKTILFGQHSKYKIRDVAEVRLRRLVERYADADQEGFVMFMRSDGNLLDAGTHPLKYLSH